MKIDKDRVRDVVRQVVDEALGNPAALDRPATNRDGWRRFDDQTSFKSRELITESDVILARRENRPLVVRPGAVFTPAARDAIERYGTPVTEATDNEKSVEAVRKVAAETPAAPAPVKAQAPAPAPAAPGVLPILPVAADGRGCTKGAVAIACDHGGLEMKKLLLDFLQKEAGIPCQDLGTHTIDAVDYPDYAKKVADLVAKGECCRGIVIDGAGIGSSMAANKVRGVRAAHCSNVVEARNAREHNDANVLSLGGRIIGIEMAKAIAIVFLKTDFAGGRHQARVNKIMGIEKA